MPRTAPHGHAGKVTAHDDKAADDGAGAYSRETLELMDARFRAALMRAIAAGKEKGVREETSLTPSVGQ
jgi:hypothetical protein